MSHPVSGPSLATTDTSGLTHEQSNPDSVHKPTQPDVAPPPYTVVAADSHPRGQPQSYPQPISYSNSQQQDFYNQYDPQLHHNHHFGPTPISASLPVLPYAYYQPRADADRRALRRFGGAAVVGLGIYLAVGLVLGMEIGGVW